MSQIGQTIINTTDTVFLGRINEIALGAAAISGLLFATICMIAYGLASGTQIIVARLDGEKNHEKIGPLVNQSFLMLFVGSLIVLFLAYLFIKGFLGVIVHSVEIKEACTQFLSYRIWGFIPLFLFQGYRAFYLGIASTKILSIATAVMALFNVLLNYLLVFGNWGFPALGISGSAIASVISEFIALFFMVFYTYKSQIQFKWGLFKNMKFNFSLITEINHLSLPLIMQYFVSLVSWFCFFLIIEKMSSRDLAISNLARNVYLIIMVPVMAFSGATSTIVGNLIGQQKQHEVLESLKSIIAFCVSVTLAGLILNLIFPKVLLQIFTNDINLIDASIPSLKIISISLFLFAIAIPLLNAVSATGNSKIAFLIEFFTLFIYLSFSYYLGVVLKASLQVVWTAEFLYFILIGISSFLYLRWYTNNYKSKNN